MPSLPLRVFSVLAMCGQITLAQVAPAAAAGPPLMPLGTARLIAAPQAASDGVWTIGIAIALQPKAITYWRSPGEAGVPPMFDFAASTNVATTDVAFPAPKRIREGDIDANGYDGEVIFPVRVVPSDKGAPTTVRLKLDYATCERVCLPAHADLTLDLPAPSGATDGARLARAEAAVPRIIDAKATADVADVVTDTRPGGTVWRVSPKAEFAGGELFAEGPDGFFLTTTRESDGYHVSVAEHPAGQVVPKTVRFTMVGPADAVEFTLRGD